MFCIDNGQVCENDAFTAPSLSRAGFTDAGMADSSTLLARGRRMLGKPSADAARPLTWGPGGGAGRLLAPGVARKTATPGKLARRWHRRQP
jgi:hypothetical protein